MVINEVFSNPTVKQVIFQIRYPNLFFIEDKIGNFQMSIMEKFPESALLFRRQIVFADVGLKVKIEESPKDVNEQGVTKIWQFNSPQKVELNVLSDSLDIHSQFHKTYKNPGSDNKFRDTIQFVVENFLKLTNVPIINRIGLRYIDECPIPAKENEAFCKYYNTSFNVNRFNISDALEMEFRTTVVKNGNNIRYIESLKQVDGQYKLILDFDAFATGVKASDYLTVTDKLHEIIQMEFEKSIKEPVFEYMRTPKL